MKMFRYGVQKRLLIHMAYERDFYILINLTTSYRRTGYLWCMSRKDKPGSRYAMTFVSRRERLIPLLLVDLGRSAGHDLVHQIMILPYSHSPSVIKPSQAMSTARHQNGGRWKSYESVSQRLFGPSKEPESNTAAATWKIPHIFAERLVQVRLFLLNEGRFLHEHNFIQ